MFVNCISGRRNLAAPHLQQADWLHIMLMLRTSQSLLDLDPVKNRN
jgi:hypothetical protein